MGGTYYFLQYAYPNTTINGEDYSFQNITKFSEYKKVTEPIQITGRGDKTFVLQPEEIELERKMVDAPEIDKNPLLWPVLIFETHSYEAQYEYRYNEQKLSNALMASELMKDQTESVDAKIELGDTGYSILPEKIGTKIGLEELVEALFAELAAGDSAVTIPDTAYVQPKIKEDNADLISERDFLNSAYETKIEYDFVDRKYTFTGKTMVDLYDKMPDGEYVINYDRTRAMLAQMATETDTFGTDREFTTYYGNTITIPGYSSIYGWLMDVDSTTEEFIGWLEERHSEETTPFYFRKAMNRETDEIGNTYIEIDLDDQWMYIYMEGDLIDEGPVVSGQPNLGTPTPVAVNYIIDKMTDRYLEGIMPDTGEPYKTLVNYWFSINWSDVGIHNSTWRTSFGGNIYLWNGSYGCINVIDHLAETIYYNIPIGTPVISY